MAQYKLSHITDLADLSDEDVLHFAAELPLLVATFRQLKKAAAEEGVSLPEQLPSITYAPEIGDQVIMRKNDGAVIALEGREVLAADAADRLAGETIQRARHRP